MADFAAFLLTHKLGAFGVVLVLAVIVSAWMRRDGRLDKMPGPKGNPLTGIGISLPPNAPAVLREWAHQYGDVYKMRVGWYNWVVINSPDLFREVFDKQATITSSKQPQPMGDDVVSLKRRMFLLPYGPKWKAYRAITHSFVSPSLIATFIPTQEFEAKQLMYDLAFHNENQTDFYRHVRRMAFSIIMTSGFGTRVSKWDHEDVQSAEKVSRILGEITRPGVFLVDEFPFLANLLPRWLQPGLAKAKAAQGPLLEAKMRLWRRVQEQRARGKAPASWARDMMENDKSWRGKGLQDEDAAWVTGGTVEVGLHTSSVTLLHLIKFLAAYPHAQEAAQDELMRVVGPDRAPTYDDIQQLPYVRACIKEVGRMCPTPIFGIKHFSDADLTCGPYTIPKGTVLLANTSFLNFDPTRFPNPFEFRPERYLDHAKSSADYAAASDPHARDHFSFGGGRRICPGIRLAENTLNIAAANMMWAFEVKKPLVDGVEAELDMSDDSYEPSSFRGPKPFAVRFVPRGHDRLDKVKTRWEKAAEEGYILRGTDIGVEGVKMV